MRIVLDELRLRTLAVAVAFGASLAASPSLAAVQTFEGNELGDIVTIQNLTFLHPVAPTSPTGFTVTNLGDAYGNVVAVPYFDGPLGATTFFGLFGGCYPGDPPPPATPSYCGATISFDYLVMDNTSGRPNAGDLGWASRVFVVGNVGNYIDPEKLYGKVFIDNVEVVRNYIAVPEPATWAMMLLGFGFVGGAVRAAKRRKNLSVSFT